MIPLSLAEIRDDGIRQLGRYVELSQLQTLLMNCSAKWIAVTGIESINWSVLDTDRQIVGIVGQSNANVAFLPLQSSELWGWHESRLGLALTGALLAPERFGIVFIKRDLLVARDALTHSVHPVWDFWLRTISSEAEPALPLAAPAADSDDALLFHRDLEVPGLVPKKPSRDSNWLGERIQKLPLQDLAKGKLDRIELLALRAGLFQWHDFLDESHQCSQQIEGEGLHRNGDYWHAIMHRREPDYSNSKYWFRSVGKHPVFARLASVAHRILLESGATSSEGWIERLGVPKSWDSFAFVDLCQSVARQSDPIPDLVARQIQRAEQSLLLSHTFAAASGEN